MVEIRTPEIAAAFLRPVHINECSPLLKTHNFKTQVQTANLGHPADPWRRFPLIALRKAQFLLALREGRNVKCGAGVGGISRGYSEGGTCI